MFNIPKRISVSTYRLIRADQNIGGALLEFSMRTDMHLNFMLGHMKFSDTAILCNRPNNCCQQRIKYSNEHLFPWGCFHERVTITQLTVQIV